MNQPWICAPHPDPPSHLPLHPIPLGHPSAPGPSTCLMHNLFLIVIIEHLPDTCFFFEKFSFLSVIFFFVYLCFFCFVFPFIFISWRLITLQYCSGFCHTLTWISHGFTCIPHLESPSHLSLHPIPLGLPSAPGPSTCLMHPAWAGELQTPIFKSHCLGFWCSSISNFIIL